MDLGGRVVPEILDRPWRVDVRKGGMIARPHGHGVGEPVVDKAA